jgi:hypothetical protein
MRCLKRARISTTIFWTNAPFAELVCLSKSSVAEEYYAERIGNRWFTE